MVQKTRQVHKSTNSKVKSEKIVISRVPAGFPSPAADFSQEMLDLNDMVVEHPAATYYVRVQGHSMINAGINTGDLLVVDRSKDAIDGSIVVAVIDGEFTVKRVGHKNGQLLLIPENEKYNPIEIREGMQVEIWGVVTFVIHNLQAR